MKWKEDRKRRKDFDNKKKKDDNEKKAKQKGIQLKTGRELFMYDPTMFVDDEEAADDYEQEVIEE